MKVRFWGVRGSIPCPGPATVRYGGNTLCLELLFPEPGRRIIIDAGSGIRELGEALKRDGAGRAPFRMEIFLTHTHWDHIMGFPFFAPIHQPGAELTIYGPVTHEENTLEGIVGGQLAYRHFPVRMQELAARIDYIYLNEGQYDLGDGIILKTKYLNHSILCLGYRFEYRGRVLCTAFDTEPFQNIFLAEADDPGYDEDMATEGLRAAREENQRVTDFFTGADLLIHDAQYTLEEYEAKKGWGHSAFEHAVSAAREAGVERLALIHHDPLRTDAELDMYGRLFQAAKKPDIFFAREGTVIEL